MKSASPARRAAARAALPAAAAALGALMLVPAAGTAAPLASHRSTAIRLSDTPPVVGVVRDPSGRPVPNVQVVIPALNREAVTDEAGVFSFRALPAGTYHITSLLIGYAPGHAEISVASGASAEVRVSIVMRTSAVTLSAVQVTASPLGTDARNVAKASTELSGKALARSTSTSIAQTLANEPGVAVRFDGPAASAPVIRGLSGERVLVLQDGERAGDLSATSQDHSVSIDPLVAQRIEVVRGPASLLYGNNALGGVVNVISNDIPTTIPTRANGYVALQGESATPGGGGSAGVTAPLGRNVAVVARAGGRGVQDLRTGGGASLENSYFRNYYGVAGVGLAHGGTTGGAVYRGYRFDYGLPSADNEGSHIAGRRDEVSARGDVAIGSEHLSSLRLNGSAQWYAHDEIQRSGAVGTSFALQTQTLDALARTKFGRVAGAVGASALLRQYSAAGEEALTPAANSRSAGAFLYEEIPLSSSTDSHATPSLQLGGRYDLYRITSQASDIAKFGPAVSRDFNNVSGSIGVNVPFGAGFSAGVSAARAFRAPTVEELFSNAFHAAAGSYDVGNAKLQSETNSGLDGILRAQSGKLSGQLSAYYNRVSNYVLPTVVGDTTIEGDDGAPRAVPLNVFAQGDATLKGVEGRVEGEVVRHVVLGLVGDVVRGALTTGTALPYLPAGRLGATGRWDDGRFSVDAEVRHAFAQSQVPASQLTDDAATALDERALDPSATRTGAYTLVNLSVGFNALTGGRVTNLTLRADNLFDVRYVDATSRIKNFAANPGRNISLVYKLLY